jgi:hypothetical protein
VTLELGRAELSGVYRSFRARVYRAKRRPQRSGSFQLEPLHQEYASDQPAYLQPAPVVLQVGSASDPVHTAGFQPGREDVGAGTRENQDGAGERGHIAGQSAAD